MPQSHLQQSQSHQEVTVKRRVSRVESLRNLFFSSKGGHPVDARRRFLLKKRTRSEEKEKVKHKLSMEAAKLEPHINCLFDFFGKFLFHFL